MVIINSDSCGTLVDLNLDVKPNDGILSQDRCVPTRILLPDDGFGDDSRTLHLSSTIEDVDQHLQSIPEIRDNANIFLTNPPKVLDETCSERILYVHQGEIAHAVPSQCDILVSDKATTCHILAVRSTCSSSGPFTSLTHIDGVSYESSIRQMFEEHKKHYQRQRVSEEEQRNSCGYLRSSENMIDMQVHIVGGFRDDEGYSRQISNFLIDLLVRIAHEESSHFLMRLQTCAISSLNDTGLSYPVGRGLGIHLKSGDVFLARVDESVAGPAMDLRSVRLWGSHPDKQLSVIQTMSSSEGCFTIAPFQFKSFANIDGLLRLPDHTLLQYTSTSPQVEDSDFCFSVRRSLKFLKSKRCQDIFGRHCLEPVTYTRVGHTNKWERR